MATPLRILSTRTLTPSQKERLLHAGFGVVERNFVSTASIPFEAPQTINRAIITSSNAITPIRDKGITIAHCYCVGQKTATRLKAAGYNPEVIANSSEELANTLVKDFKGEHFHFLGTASRRDELPAIFKRNNTLLTEIPVYETRLNPGNLNSTFDGILFFSPSAITSYMQDNDPGSAVLFCIGPTTAGDLQDTKGPVVIARKPSAEHLILEVINYFNAKKNII